ncbi:MAG: sulfite exporter TauE/SafE family protein [Nevskiaceae bacterium]|nr:MAG: sulfite exporter TauE/SafE family protein [Nevskiaceae bacterium]TBR73914.1 MAG: sulfite exporter TauE/SafE family protein [Nevskiaceae bacterium]
MLETSATLVQQLLSIGCGGLVGFSLALTGGGGSTLAVPLLLYVVGIQDAHMAIGTSALAVAVNAYANLIPHARAGHVRWRMGLVFTATGIVGAFLGSELGKVVDGRHLIGLFAMLVLVVAVFMVRPKPKCAAGQPPLAQPPPPALPARLSASGLGAGAIAGFFGVGGGFLIVPGLMLAARIPIIDAIGTSLFGVGSFGLTTAFNYARSGMIDWPIAGLFIFGGIAGGWLGAIAARHLSTRHGALNWIFAGLIFAIGVYMLFRTYG